MSGTACAHEGCGRRITTGQYAVWVPPRTRDWEGERQVITGIPYGWVHDRHVPRGPLRFRWYAALSSERNGRTLRHLWNETGRPRLTEREGRRRFDDRCAIAIPSFI